jgi:hypothetical protein
MAIVMALLSFASVIAAKLSADEVKAWIPWLVRRIVALAVHILPEDQRGRYGEEWLGHIDEIPGDIGRVIVAIGFLFAGFVISLGSRKQTEVEACVGPPARAGRSAYSPGRSTLGLLPEPESRSLSFLISSSILTFILLLILCIGGAMNHIPFPGPTNLLIR